MKKKRIKVTNLIPTAHFQEFHSLWIPASVEDSWFALKNLDIKQSRLISLLFNLRQIKIKYPTNSQTKKTGWSRTWLGFFSSGFHPIIIDPPRTLILWSGLNSPTIQGFVPQNTLYKTNHQLNDRLLNYLQLQQDADLGWDIQVIPSLKKGCMLTTETRVYFRSKRYKKLFYPYWFIIRIFSGVIRRELLRIIRTNAIKKEFLVKS